MESPAVDLEQAARIAAVETSLDGYRDDCGALAPYRGRLIDGTAVRLFALQSPEEAPLRTGFERLGTEWERAGRHPGVTSVRARGEEPVPWIAVEYAPGDLFRDVAPELSAIERRTVLAEIAETLWRVGIPHLACTPDRIAIDRERGAAVYLDWAIDRLCLPGSENPYVAPELREDPAAGDERSDVYTLGALAWYALTGSAPDPGPHGYDASGRGAGNTTRWLAERAMESDPDERFDSPYEVKRGALFGASERTDPGTDVAPGGREANRGRPSEVTGPTGGEDGQQTSEVGTESTVDGPDSTSRFDVGAVGRRRVLTAAGAATALATAVGGWYWSRRDTGGEGEVAVEPRPNIAAEFDSGVIGVRNAGTTALEADRLALSGTGFVAPPGGRLSGYRGKEEFDPGAVVRIAADPAYELELVYERGEKRRTVLDSEGPAADEHEPEPGTLYTPELQFDLEVRDGQLHVEFVEGATVPADHVRFAGSGFDGAPIQYWSDRPDVGDKRHVGTGDATSYRVTPETIIRVEWAPPYLSDATTVAQYEGAARPLDGELGGVAGYRYDEQNTGTTSSAAGFGEKPTVAWSVGLDGEVRGTLALAAGRLFASVGQYLYALDATDGEVLWRRYVGVPSVLEPAVRGGSVFVGTANPSGRSKLYAFDAADGSTRWEFAADASGLWSPTVSDRILFTGATEPGGDIYALDPQDGTNETVLEEGAQVRYSAFDGRRLYIRSRNGGGNIEAFAPGGREWSYPARGTSSPVVADGTVYGIDDPRGDSGRLFAVDARDGTEQWSLGVVGEPRGPPAATGRTVFAGTDNGVVYAIRAEDGIVRWRTREPEPVGHPPVVAGDTVYFVTTNGRIRGRGTDDGRRRWSIDGSGSRNRQPRITTEPVVSDGWLYVGTVEGIVAHRRA